MRKIISTVKGDRRERKSLSSIGKRASYAEEKNTIEHAIIVINTQPTNHTRGLFNLTSIFCPLSGIATPNIRNRIIIAKSDEVNAIINIPTRGGNLDVNGMICKKKRKKIMGTLANETTRNAT